MSLSVIDFGLDLRYADFYIVDFVLDEGLLALGTFEFLLKARNLGLDLS